MQQTESGSCWIVAATWEGRKRMGPASLPRAHGPSHSAPGAADRLYRRNGKGWRQNRSVRGEVLDGKGSEYQAQKRTVKSCRKPPTCVPHGKATNSITDKVTELAYNMQTLSGTSAWVSTFTSSAMPRCHLS